MEKLKRDSLEGMICEVVRNGEHEIINRHEDAKIYDRANALRVIGELSTYLPQLFAASNLPGNSLSCKTTPNGWKMLLDASVEIEVDEQGRIVSQKCEKVKYFLIDIEFKSHSEGDNSLNELDITTQYRYVDYPPLGGGTSLPEALSSEKSLAGHYTTFSFDQARQVVKCVAKMEYFEGIHIICDWAKYK